MLFMAVFHNNEMGGGVRTAARWQHGPVKGVKEMGGWTASGNGQNFHLFEAETNAQVSAFTSYLQPYASRIEVFAVKDQGPANKAIDARDPDLNSNATPQAKALARKYMAAKTVKEAVAIWASQ